MFFKVSLAEQPGNYPKTTEYSHNFQARTTENVIKDTSSHTKGGKNLASAFHIYIYIITIPIDSLIQVIEKTDSG